MKWNFVLPVDRSTSPAFPPVVSVILYLTFKYFADQNRRCHSECFVPFVSVSRTIFLIGKYILIFTHTLQHDDILVWEKMVLNVYAFLISALWIRVVNCTLRKSCSRVSLSSITWIECWKCSRVRLESVAKKIICPCRESIQIIHLCSFITMVTA
jgi:hypothetical protein